MKKNVKILVGVTLIGVAFIIAAANWKPAKAEIPVAKLHLAAPKPGAMPAVYDAPAFAFVDQNNRPLAASNLRGKVWISDFIFTHCGNTCPIMTSKMVALQKEILDPNIIFVSFSVDPDRDKPTVLKEYAEKYRVDEKRWFFLAPPDMKAVLNVAVGMRITGRPIEENNPLLHADRFVLVDQIGKVRGTYYSGDAEAMKKLVTDAQTLAKMGGHGE